MRPPPLLLCVKVVATARNLHARIGDLAPGGGAPRLVAKRDDPALHDRGLESMHDVLLVLITLDAAIGHECESIAIRRELFALRRGRRMLELVSRLISSPATPSSRESARRATPWVLTTSPIRSRRSSTSGSPVTPMRRLTTTWGA